MVVECEHATACKIKLAGMPVKFTELVDPKHVRYPPPVLGQHTVEVLRDVLGKSKTEVDRLISKKVVYN